MSGCIQAAFRQEAWRIVKIVFINGTLYELLGLRLPLFFEVILDFSLRKRGLETGEYMLISTVSGG
jgi:hypothetical protein